MRSRCRRRRRLKALQWAARRPRNRRLLPRGENRWSRRNRLWRCKRNNSGKGRRGGSRAASGAGSLQRHVDGRAARFVDLLQVLLVIHTVTQTGSEYAQRTLAGVCDSRLLIYERVEEEEKHGREHLLCHFNRCPFRFLVFRQIDLANEIFGFSQWSSSVGEVTVDYVCLCDRFLSSQSLC